MKKARFAALLAVALMFPAAGRAGEPPKEPILRIEAGMHTTTIRRIGVDAANRHLVTGSLDKTVRVWELPSLRLLRILRPPIGSGNEGKLDSVAISPDGSTVAVGGWTGYEWDGKHSIYIMDRETGAMKHRITGLPNVINHMDWSDDGKYLAAVFGGSIGVHVYKVPGYSLAGKDGDYKSRSNGAAFFTGGGANRLATACYDGFIRLYSMDGSGLRLLDKKQAKDGKEPMGIAFSPDGKKIAVGYNGVTRVSVYSAEGRLEYLFSPDTAGISSTGQLSSVAWSSDGAVVYAGGNAKNKEGEQVIFRWADAGRGARSETPASLTTVMHILPLKDGGVVYSAGDPSVGVINRRGARTAFLPAPIADHRDAYQDFKASFDAEEFRFNYEKRKSPAFFSLRDRSLSQGEGRGRDLDPARVEGLDVKDWKNNTSPRLAGAPLKLKEYENSRSLAVFPDLSGFVLGADWSLRRFDAAGKQAWTVHIPATNWGVNVSRGGKVALASFGDGTIRWFRMTDGKELLAFFPAFDRKRWVLWTPKGYYDASPGAEDLIGWHVNNGKDRTADFFAASRFRGTFYRPDIITKVLDALDEDRAVALANDESGRKTSQASVQQMLPPVVTLVSPADGAAVTGTAVSVRFRVRSPSGEEVTGVKVLIDGRPTAGQRGLKASGKGEGDVREIEVTVPERDCELSLIAENRYASSEPASIRLKRVGGKAGDEFVAKPRLYILSVGVSDYDDKTLKLGFAAKDARDFTAAWSGQQGKLYREVVAKVLTDKQAVKDEILDGLEWIRKETTSRDVAAVFFAGHGVNDPQGNYFYLPANANTEKLMRTAVAFTDIKMTVSSIAGKALFFVDTCHSGNVMGTRRGAADINMVVNELSSSENGVVVFASSTGRQYSLEDEKWGNGAFTKALMEGIRGAADYNKNGRITINMLDLYLSERVKELTKGQQTPSTTKPATVPDFPVVAH